MRKERSERSLVGIAPGEVVARDEEVQLVAVVAVPAREDHEEKPDPGRKPQYGAGRVPGTDFGAHVVTFQR